MEIETPAAALEREHREIDEAVTAFLREPADEGRRGGLRTALHELRHHIYLEEEFLFPLLSSMEDALTIEPPPLSAIVGATARVPRKVPNVLIRQTSSNSSSG